MKTIFSLKNTCTKQTFFFKSAKSPTIFAPCAVSVKYDPHKSRCLARDLHQSPTSRQPAHVLARLEIVVPHYCAFLQFIFSFVFQKLIVYFTARLTKLKILEAGE